MAQSAETISRVGDCPKMDSIVIIIMIIIVLVLVLLIITSLIIIKLIITIIPTVERIL